MKLSVGMITGALEISVKCADTALFFEELCLCRYAFYDGEDRLHNDTLYILSNEMIACRASRKLLIEKGTVLFWHGKSEVPPILTPAVVYMIDPEQISLFALANKIGCIFEKYQQLECDMRQAVSSRASMQQLVTLATPLFDNEITIRDRNHRYIAQSYETIRFSALSGEAQPDRNGYSSDDEIHDLKNETEYEEEHQANRPWIYSRDGYQLLCYDIFLNDRFIYRIKITDTTHPFREYDSELLIYFAEIVKEKYQTLSTLYPERHDEFTAFLEKLLQDGSHLSDQELQTNLDAVKWKMDHSYLFLCMRPGNSKGILKAYSYYRRMLNEKYKNTYTIEYQGKLLLLANLSIKYRNLPDPLLRELIPFLRDENFRAGISMVFHNIKNAQYFYTQSAEALDLGMTCTPALWYYPFADYRFQYLYKSISDEFPSAVYLMPELHRLHQIDLENQTEYINTLQSFLENSKNISQAAKKLNIHRSTMEYRLQKITELSGLDYENNDTALLASLLLRISNGQKDYL